MLEHVNPAYDPAWPIGKRYRWLRTRAGFTMGEVARDLGISVTTVSDFERGRCELSVEQLGYYREFIGYPDELRGDDALDHVGFAANRLDREPREKVFADAWKAENHPLIRRGDALIPDITKRDAQVAATMMQWLGSPVGFCWLTDALRTAGYEVREIKEGK